MLKAITGFFMLEAVKTRHVMLKTILIRLGNSEDHTNNAENL